MPLLVSVRSEERVGARFLRRALAAMVGSALLSMPLAAAAFQELEDVRPKFVLNEWARVDGDSGQSFLARPAGVAVDRDAIYVLDAGNYRVAVFSRAGEFQSAFGERGQGPGEFSLAEPAVTAAEIAVSDVHVAVFDPTQRRIHVFDREGRFLHSVAFAKAPRSLAYSATNELHVLLGGYDLDDDGEVVVLDNSGEISAQRVTPLFKTDSAVRLRANANAMAVGRGNTVAQAYRFWPLIRITPAVGQPVLHRLGPEWWRIPPLAERSAESLRGFSVEAGDEAMATQRWTYFRDLEYVPSDDIWVALSLFATIHVFDPSGRLLRAARLLPPVGAEPAYMLEDIGVDPAGTMVCAADTSVTSVVACYEFPEGLQR